MANVNINNLTQIREETGASIMSIKKALEDAEGDKAKALDILKKQSFQIASKKEERQTKAGIIDVYLHPNKKIGVLVEVDCETDFVAKNDEFQRFVHDIAMHIAASNPKDEAVLFEEPFVKNQNMKVGDTLKEAIAKFGEKIEIKKFVRLEI